MVIVEYETKQQMMSEIAEVLSNELSKALKSQGKASLAVPGGTTPGPIFDLLCEKNLAWPKVGVMLTDERWVPEDSERSNTRLLKERLFRAAAAEAQYVPLYAKADTPEEQLGNLEQGLKAHLPLDVLLLGMGADMHTASIFPQADKLDEALFGEDNIVPMRAPGAPEPRITLSANVLKQAKHIHVVIIGDEKREALARAQTLPPQDAPISVVLKHATVHWTKG